MIFVKNCLYYVKKSIGREDCSLLACCHLVAAAGMAQSLERQKTTAVGTVSSSALALVNSGDS